jgi:hypothetical protein
MQIFKIDELAVNPGQKPIYQIILFLTFTAATGVQIPLGTPVKSRGYRDVAPFVPPDCSRFVADVFVSSTLTASFRFRGTK